jgi:hypothetical protein
LSEVVDLSDNDHFVLVLHLSRFFIAHGDAEGLDGFHPGMREIGSLVDVDSLGYGIEFLLPASMLLNPFQKKWERPTWSLSSAQTYH